MFYFRLMQISGSTITYQDLQVNGNSRTSNSLKTAVKGETSTQENREGILGKKPDFWGTTHPSLWQLDQQHPMSYHHQWCPPAMLQPTQCAKTCTKPQQKPRCEGPRGPQPGADLHADAIKQLVPPSPPSILPINIGAAGGDLTPRWGQGEGNTSLRFGWIQEGFELFWCSHCTVCPAFLV